MVKFIEIENSLQGLGRGKNGELFNGHRISVLQDKKFWKFILVMTAQNMNTLNTTELTVVKMCILPYLLFLIK